MCKLEDGLVREKIRKEKCKIVMIIVRDNSFSNIFQKFQQYISGTGLGAPVPKVSGTYFRNRF